MGSGSLDVIMTSRAAVGGSLWPRHTVCEESAAASRRLQERCDGVRGGSEAGVCGRCSAARRLHSLNMLFELAPAETRHPAASHPLLLGVHANDVGEPDAPLIVREGDAVRARHVLAHEANRTAARPTGHSRMQRMHSLHHTAVEQTRRRRW